MTAVGLVSFFSDHHTLAFQHWSFKKDALWLQDLIINDQAQHCFWSKAFPSWDPPPQKKGGSLAVILLLVLPRTSIFSLSQTMQSHTSKVLQATCSWRHQDIRPFLNKGTTLFHHWIYFSINIYQPKLWTPRKGMSTHVDTLLVTISALQRK